jgi:alkylation response protein AidB-like acyl-CoA dehydrogenase
MGLKGTSTAQVVLENVRVPVENLLGEAGKGHKIAFNVLNIGRLKLSATVLGAAKAGFAEAAKYAVERKQFGQPLASFGAIREKLADMLGSLFAAESLL